LLQKTAQLSFIKFCFIEKKQGDYFKDSISNLRRLKALSSFLTNLCTKNYPALK